MGHSAAAWQACDPRKRSLRASSASRNVRLGLRSGCVLMVRCRAEPRQLDSIRVGRSPAPAMRLLIENVDNVTARSHLSEKPLSWRRVQADVVAAKRLSPRRAADCRLECRPVAVTNTQRTNNTAAHFCDRTTPSSATISLGGFCALPLRIQARKRIAIAVAATARTVIAVAMAHLFAPARWSVSWH